MDYEKNKHECKIFVGNVPFQCTKEEFEKVFEHFDGFVGAEIINRFNSSFSRGFGFISFDNEDNVKKALELQQTREITFKDRTLRLSEYNFEGTEDNGAEKRPNDNNHKNFIFIKNVGQDTSRDDLFNLFSEHGKVIRCFINTDIKTGASKGTAIVELDDIFVVEDLLSQRILNLENGNIVELVKWNNKPKVKKHKQVEPTDLYRTAFNAGRSIGFREGMTIAKGKQISKQQFFKNTKPFNRSQTNEHIIHTS